MRARHVGFFAQLEGRRRHVLSNQAFIDAIVRVAANRLGPRRARSTFILCWVMIIAAHRHHCRLVLSLV
jgi:hypothetical protein